jgi:hypothetical protein
MLRVNSIIDFFCRFGMADCGIKQNRGHQADRVVSMFVLFIQTIILLPPMD